MIDATLFALAGWLLNYLLHSSLLLGGAWSLERLGLLRSQGQREAVWRCALFGALLTASLQAGLPSTLPMTWQSGSNLLHAAANRQHPLAADGAAALSAPAAPAVEHEELVASPPTPASTESGRPRLALPDEARALLAPLAAAWLLTCTLGLLLTLLRLAQLQLSTRRLPRSEDARLNHLLAALAGRVGIRTPGLRISAHWASPLVTPGGDICLPSWSLQRLTPLQQQAVLAHELAHLLRRDPAWRLAAQLMAKLGCLQPLNALALRRLDAVAEQACDDWAARACGAPQALAESLYHCAQALKAQRLPALASAMAARHSPLMQRIRHLMEHPMNTEIPKSRPMLRWSIAAAVLLVATALPAIVVGKSGDAGRYSLGELFGQLLPGGQQLMTIRSTSPSGELRIKLRGSVTFNDTEDSVLSLTGQLTLDETRDGTHRHAVFEPDAKAATIKRVYSLNGLEQAPDAEGQRWLAEMLGMASEQIYGSKARMQRLFARGGIELVLADVEKARDDGSRRRRIEALLSLGEQEDATLARVLALVAPMNSDFERSAALRSVLGHRTLSPDLQLGVLAALKGVDSDFERRQVLEALNAQLGDSPALLAAWQTALKPIDSDFELRSVIQNLMERPEPSPAQIDAALQACLQLKADFEHRSALEAVARRLKNPSTALVSVYAKSAQHIESDFERRAALSAMLERQPLERESYLALLDAAEGMHSDFERLSLLTAVAAHMPADRELIERYRQRARGLSDFERGQAEKALDHLEVKG